MRLHKSTNDNRHYFWVTGDLGAVSWEAVLLPPDVGAKMAGIWDHPIDMPAFRALPKPVQRYGDDYWMSLDVAQHFPANRRSGSPCDLVETEYCNVQTAMSCLLGPQVLRDWLESGRSDDFVADTLQRYYLEMKADE